MPNSSTDSTDLQQSLTSVNSSIESYQLSLALSKYQHLPIICHPDTDNASNQYFIGNQKISSLSALHYLGVVVSSNVKWHRHICSIVSKAFICLHHILHSFSSNVCILLKAYITCIRTLLEYDTVIWSLFLKSYIFMIESVQKGFTKKNCYCCNICNTSYSHCLNFLNLKSFECRRVEFDLMFMYKVIHGYVDLNFNDFLSVCCGGCSWHRYGFIIKPLRRPCMKHLNNFFMHRASQIGTNYQRALFLLLLLLLSRIV